MSPAVMGIKKRGKVNQKGTPEKCRKKNNWKRGLFAQESICWESRVVGRAGNQESQKRNCSTRWGKENLGIGSTVYGRLNRALLGREGKKAPTAAWEEKLEERMFR